MSTPHMALRLLGAPLRIEVHSSDTGREHGGEDCWCDPWVQGWVDGGWWWLHVGGPGVVEDRVRDATPVRDRHG